MNFDKFKETYQKTPVIEHPNTVTKKLLVSVCVMTYQQVNYIKDCLDGILNQKTDFPFEILLGEDASTDGTREICIEYAKAHPDKIRLFLHTRENNIKIGGQGTAWFNYMNNLFQSNGKYIAICEGDDFWVDPQKLQKQVDVLENNPGFSGVTTNFCYADVDGNIIKAKKYENVNETVFGFHKLLTYRILNRTLVTMYIKKLEAIELLADFVDVTFGDRVLQLIMFNYGDIKYIDDVTAAFREGSGYYSPVRYTAGIYQGFYTWRKLYFHFRNTPQESVVWINLHIAYLKIYKLEKWSGRIRFIYTHLIKRKKENPFSLLQFLVCKNFAKSEIPESSYVFNA
jgi:glycosyltransferase involved in cell wall biosynthesis